jgi:hypothetical protein
MIFRQYQIYSDGRFHQFGMTSLVRGEFDYFSDANSFLKDVGTEFFPTIEFQSIDKIPPSYKECLSKIFFLNQLKFFAQRGWIIKILELDIHHEELFGCSTLLDSKHAEELGVRVSDLNDFLNPETISRLVFQYLYNLGQRTFWVEGFTSDFLLVHTTRKHVSRSDALLVK